MSVHIKTEPFPNRSSWLMAQSAKRSPEPVESGFSQKWRKKGNHRRTGMSWILLLGRCSDQLACCFLTLWWASDEDMQPTTSCPFWINSRDSLAKWMLLNSPRTFCVIAFPINKLAFQNALIRFWQVKCHFFITESHTQSHQRYSTLKWVFFFKGSSIF